MAKNVFDATVTRKVFLDIRFPGNGIGVELPGHFKADTVEVTPNILDGNEAEYAVFVVDEPHENAYPHIWVGEYRLSVKELKRVHPEYFIGYVPPDQKPEE